MDEPRDGILIERILSGDKDMYRVLVERYKQVIFNLAYRMTGSIDDAFDISQETFIRAYQALPRFRTDERFFSWLYTICLNVTRNFLRQRKRQRLVFQEIAKGEAGHANPEDSFLEKERDLGVQALLAEVPETYRAAVIMRYNDGLSYEEIASILNLSISGAKMRVKRGLDKLRAVMKQRGFSDEEA